MKRLKLILTICLIVCVSAIACLFTACGDEGGEQNKEPATSLTVTVLLADGTTPAENVSVVVCDTGAGGLCRIGVKTNANGSATISLTDYNVPKTDKLEIHLSHLPEGYVYADDNGTPYETDQLKDGDHGKQIPASQDKLTITLKTAN